MYGYNKEISYYITEKISPNYLHNYPIFTKRPKFIQIVCLSFQNQIM